MSYPRELLYLFPAIPFLPENISKAFIQDPLTQAFSKLIEDNRYHLLSKYVKFNWWTRYLTNDETLELFKNFKSASNLTQRYYSALIERKTNEIEIKKSDISYLLTSYEKLSILVERQKIKEKGEALGVFVEEKDWYDEIETLKKEIRIQRRLMCLFQLGINIRFEEIDAIFKQYPFFKRDVFPYTDETDLKKCKEIIRQSILSHIGKHICFDSPIDLNNENQQLAEALGDAIFSDSPQRFSEQAKNYRDSVHKKLLDELSKYRQVASAQSSESISQLFSGFTNSLFEHADRLAQAYQFIQYTGFGSQSDFFLFDVYSAARNAQNVSEFKHAIYGILKPFHPIVREYQSIGLYETNELRKVIRIMIPLLILTATFIAVAAILAPLALPEIAFWAALVPSIFIGLGLTSLYCKVKDNLYQSIRQTYYGGQYQLPEFQVNERMNVIFGNSASIVQQFYIELLKQCQANDELFSGEQKKGLLTDEQSKRMNENRQQLHLLLKEWHDIHENHQITQEEVLKITRNQMVRVINKKRSQLSQLVESNYDKEVEGWDNIAKNVTTTEPKNPIANAGKKFVSQLSLFNQIKRSIDEEAQVYAPILIAIN
jgi:hypothetical protein